MGSPRLHALDHQLIRHVVDVFANDTEEVRRETISGLSDPKFYKVKSSRWRGAVFFDSDGLPWLVAAGLRRAGDSDDFYAAFCADIHANGSAKYLPSDTDRERFRRECRDDLFTAWETSVHNDTLDALSSAEGRWLRNGI